MDNQPIKGYKAYDKDLNCRGFQYEVGKEYELPEDKVKVCETGFHFCENPFDVLRYYPLTTSRFTEVESRGSAEKHNEDSKVATRKIYIGAEIKLPAFINACFKFIYEKIDWESQAAASGNYGQAAASGYKGQAAASGDNGQAAASGNYGQAAASGYKGQAAASGDNGQAAASGDNGQAAASGYNGQAAASGDNGQAAASGYNGQAAASGNYGQAAASGDNGQAAASGNYGQAAASGDKGQAAASGNYGQAAASGYKGQAAASGDNGVSVSTGIEGMAKAKKGNWIVLAEYDKIDGTYILKEVKSVQVDGEVIKADTFYSLVKGEFKEIEP